MRALRGRFRTSVRRLWGRCRDRAGRCRSFPLLLPGQEQGKVKYTLFLLGIERSVCVDHTLVDGAESEGTAGVHGIATMLTLFRGRVLTQGRRPSRNCWDALIDALSGFAAILLVCPACTV